MLEKWFKNRKQIKQLKKEIERLEIQINRLNCKLQILQKENGILFERIRKLGETIDWLTKSSLKQSYIA
ncbi:hypothetical protein DRO91_03840 [Candidatus Heimdallarchaeota archaeon]|nr:MAG: hypothetical protein DRO91_03840 [Candidatus Heimdallarchaeota archaeon]